MRAEVERQRREELCPRSIEVWEEMLEEQHCALGRDAAGHCAFVSCACRRRQQIAVSVQDGLAEGQQGPRNEAELKMLPRFAVLPCHIEDYLEELGRHCV